MHKSSVLQAIASHLLDVQPINHQPVTQHLLEEADKLVASALEKNVLPMVCDPVEVDDSLIRTMAMDIRRISISDDPAQAGGSLRPLRDAESGVNPARLELCMSRDDAYKIFQESHDEQHAATGDLASIVMKAVKRNLTSGAELFGFSEGEVGPAQDEMIRRLRAAKQASNMVRNSATAQIHEFKRR